MNYLRLEEAGSTNSYVIDHAGELSDMTMVWADAQTHGRGQRGNSWESEPGANITASVLVRPQDFPAKAQFSISEATALAVVDALARFGIDAKVKWPNDIYVGDKKICGILIEHAVMGRCVARSVLGIGLNVNQREFLSDAPNPVSMAILGWRSFDLEEVRESLGRALEKRLASINAESGRADLHSEFLRRMWRRDGKRHPFTDAATLERFDAEIWDVEPDGMLVLETASGARRRYAFKEVSFGLITSS